LSSSITVSADLGPLADEAVISVDVMAIDTESETTSGLIVGRSPFRAENLLPGRYVVRAKLPNGSYEQRSVKVEEGDAGSVNIAPRPAVNEDLNIAKQTRPQVYKSYAVASERLPSVMTASVVP
jgi:hypothetical protein